MRYVAALVSIMFFTVISYPCTNFIVTKGASSDGSVFVSYTADSYGLYGELYHYPAAVYPADAMLEIHEWDTGKFLGKIPQAARTYNVVGNMNEYQVVIGETTFGGREELRDKTGLIDYGSLMYIALQRSKSAREAISVITSLVNEHGYYSSGESFSIADTEEAWIMEMIGKGTGNKGAVWVAVRIPDGYISAHANQARITTFPLNDKNNCIYSPDVISFAREKGYFNGKDSEFSFSDAYAPLDFGAVRFCDARVWSLFRRSNPGMENFDCYINGTCSDRLPLYIKPEKKLSVQDVMSLMRDHYEGTSLDMTKGVAAGYYGMPYRWRPLVWEYEGKSYFHERPISTPQTGFSFVSQARGSLPREIGGILWFGVDDSYMTVYSPMYSSITKVPHNFAKGVASYSSFSWDSAFWVFNFVSNFAYPRYSIIIDDIKKEQYRIEGEYIASTASADETAAALLKISKGQAVEYLTRFSCDAGANTHNQWKKLGENLILKYIDGVVKDENSKPKSPGYSEEFRKMIVTEQGENIMMRKLPGEESEFDVTIKKAEQLLKDKKYQESFEAFRKALSLNPESEAAKKMTEKLEKALSGIETIINN